jgi:hypothetical protein
MRILNGVLLAGILGLDDHLEKAFDVVISPGDYSLELSQLSPELKLSLL